MGGFGVVGPYRLGELVELEWDDVVLEIFVFFLHDLFNLLAGTA